MNPVKNICILDKNREIFMILSNYLEDSLQIIDDSYYRNLDTYLKEVTVTVNGSDPRSGDVTCGMFIMYPTSNFEYGLFKIIDIEEETDGLTYQKKYIAKSADHIDLLKGLVDPTTFENEKLENVIKYILTDTTFYFGYTDYEEVVNYTIDKPITKLQALVDLTQKLGVEFEFKYDTRGFVIKKRSINIVKEVGQDLGKIFIRDFDLLNVTRKEDRNKLVTAMKGYGASVVNGARLSFKDLVNPSLPPGYSFVNGSDYIVSDKAYELYAEDGIHLWGAFEDGDSSSAQELFDNTLKTLQTYDKPIYTYDIGIAYMNDLLDVDYIPYDMGDKVFVQDKTLVPELYLQARIREITTSMYNPQNGNLVLGDFIALTPRRSDQVDRLQEIINNNESQWEISSHSLRIVSSNGQFFKNRQGETTLSALVIKDGVDIDTLGTKFTYKWTARDSKGNPIRFPDGSLEKIGKHLLVKATDFESSAIFKIKLEGNI